MISIKALLIRFLITGLLCSALFFTNGLAQEKLPPHTKSGFVVTADGAKIHYFAARPIAIRSGERGRPRDETTERKKSPTLLFIPGWMTPAWIWEHQVAHFARNFQVVAMDPRSQGDSSKPADGHYPAARARDIKVLVDRLGLAPVVLVASSIAVTDVASYVAQFGTDSVAGLVLVNGIAGREYDLDTMRNLLQYANSIQTDRRNMAERFVRGLYKKPHSENYLKRMVGATLRTPTDAAMAVFLASLSSDNRSALAKIDKPTLIVVARVDSWMPFYEDLRKRIPGSQMKVFEGAGHALFVDEAPRFNSLLDEFVGSLVAVQSVHPYNPPVVMTSLLSGDLQRGMDNRTSNMDRVSYSYRP